MPTLEQSQVAMSIRNGRHPDPVAQGRVFLSMWLLYRTQRSMTASKLAKRFGFPKEFVASWIDAGCPLDGLP